MSGRRRRTVRSIGNPTEDDSPAARNSLNVPSSSASSHRTLPVTAVPTLTSICARVFVANVPKLGEDPDVWHYIQPWLKRLPEHLVPRVFAMLREAHPNLLNQAIITAVCRCLLHFHNLSAMGHQYFLRGSSVTLTNALPGVKRTTIAAVASCGNTLQHLELSGFDTFPDTLFASLLPSLPLLRVLVLR